MRNFNSSISNTFFFEILCLGKILKTCHLLCLNLCAHFWSFKIERISIGWCVKQWSTLILLLKLELSGTLVHRRIFWGNGGRERLHGNCGKLEDWRIKEISEMKRLGQWRDDNFQCSAWPSSPLLCTPWSSPPRWTSWGWQLLLVVHCTFIAISCWSFWCAAWLYFDSVVHFMPMSENTKNNFWSQECL